MKQLFRFDVWMACFAVALAAVCSTAVADDRPEVKEFLSGLASPRAIAIRPAASTDPYEIFIADAGAGKVVRASMAESGVMRDAISGFAQSSPSRSAPTGPLALHFLDASRLVVAGSDENGQSFVRIYEVGPVDQPLPSDKFDQQAERPEEPGTSASFDLFGIARTIANDDVPDLLLLAAKGGTGVAPIWKLPVRAGQFGKLAEFSRGDAVDAVSAIAVEPFGHVVLVRPPRQQANESRLQFLNPLNGKLVMDLECPLRDITGLEYSPRSGELYAIVNSSRDAAQNGVYRIAAGDKASSPVVAKKVADVAAPTALAFGEDGTLFVATGAENKEETNSGKLLKFVGDL